MTVEPSGKTLRIQSFGFRSSLFRFLALLLVALAGGSGFASSAVAGYSSIVVDATGKVYNEVNPDQLNHPASLTKMMTLYLAFEALKQGRMHLEQPLAVSAWASNKSPTKLDLRAGQSVSAHDCILGMITKSANDAATVMGEALGGNEQNFARIMTVKARQLGMVNTVFKNASGLPDPGQVTTARDLLKLANALYRDFPEYYPLFATRSFIFRGTLVRGHNHLMDRYAGMDGLKTGFTNASGFNLASSAVRGNQRLFGVVMGGRSSFARDQLMATLLDDAFAGRTTSPLRVAQAAGVNARSARRLFASLSPVGEAEAATFRPVANLAPNSMTQQIAAIQAAPTPRLVAGAGTSRSRRTRSRRVASVKGAFVTIQVGAYSRRKQAQTAAQHAARTAHLSGKPVAIMAAGQGARAFRVRFSGLSPETAQAACRALNNQGQSCAIIAQRKLGT